MEKEIKLEIAIGILLVVIIIVGGLIWLAVRQQKQIQAIGQSLKNQTPPRTMTTGTNGNGTDLKDQVALQYEERTPVIGGLKMTLPEDWIVANKTEDKTFVFTSGNSPKDALVLNVSKNNADDIKNFKDNRQGSDYTNIQGGEIFKFTGCGIGRGEICNGALVGNDVYSFTWDFESNAPVKENQKLSESPQSFSADAIWNLLKTSYAM